MAEAKRQEVRDWLSRSGRELDAALAHDARGKIVVVRFAAVDQALDRKRGLLGIVHSHGDAEQYARSIKAYVG